MLGVLKRRGEPVTTHNIPRGGDLPSFILEFLIPVRYLGLPTEASPRFVFWGPSNAMMAAVCRMSCPQLHRGVKRPHTRP